MPGRLRPWQCCRLPLEAARNSLRIGRAEGADALLSDDHEGLGVLVYDHLSGDNPAAMSTLPGRDRSMATMVQRGAAGALA